MHNPAAENTIMGKFQIGLRKGVPKCRDRSRLRPGYNWVSQPSHLSRRFIVCLFANRDVRNGRVALYLSY